MTDGQLLKDFIADSDESAFTALVERHGPMVMGVCRRVLGESADAEDAFQATFLTLARKAGSISSGRALASWLYKVAFRIALTAREQERRKRLEALPPDVATNAEAVPELQPLLDEEVSRLPEKYRSAATSRSCACP